VSREDLALVEGDEATTEGLIDHLRAVEGVQVAGLIREQVPLADGTITANRVSLRSRGLIDVSQIARKSAGGGHKQAAGFSHPGTIDDIRDFIVAEVAAQLEETDFYRPAHRTIWRALLRLADRGQPTDPVTVLGELDDSGELADVGGGPFLHSLVQAVPTVASAGHYARLVADAARRRRVIDLGVQLAHSDADPAVLAHLAGELATVPELRFADTQPVGV
jgi:hypothetical protein